MTINPTHYHNIRWQQQAYEAQADESDSDETVYLGEINKPLELPDVPPNSPEQKSEPIPIPPPKFPNSNPWNIVYFGD